MNFRKIICLASAVLMSVCAVMPVSAADDSSSKVVDPYQADQNMLTTETDKPTISFDMTDWSNLTHLTDDASKASLEVKQEKTYAYQGASLKVSGALDADINDLFTCSYLIRNDDNTLTYPEADNEDAALLSMGFTFDASEFGMNYFDGCMIAFEYRINEDITGKLMGNSIFIVPCDDDNVRVSAPLQLKINNADANNVTQFAKGVITVSEAVGATKLLVEIPLMKACEKTDIFYMDNIQVVTPLQDNGVDLRVANLDGYNENARPQEIVQGLEVKAKENTLSTADSSAESSGLDTNTILIFVGAGVLAVGVAVFVFIMVKKHKNKFY